MKSYRNRVFEHVIDDGSGSQYSDLRFEDCTFRSCGLSVTLDVAARTTVRNTEVIDCRQVGSAVDCAVFENCLVNGFDTQGQILYFWGAVFKHVEFRGRLGRFFMSPLATAGGVSNYREVNAQFATANKEYYCKVDWSIDISGAECLEFDLRGVPARLIRRDAETQVILSRKLLANRGWKDLPFLSPLVPFALDAFLTNETTLDELVLVAPKRSARSKKMVRDFKLLRKEGFIAAE